MTANLLSTLQGLTGPSREVDAAIFAAMGEPLPERFLGMNIKLERQKDGSYTMPVGNMQVRFEVPAFTASLDATIALCERVLPGWERSLSSIHPDFRSENEPRFTADLAGPISWIKDTETGALEPHYETHGGKAASEAIALLIALLRAKEARDAS